MGELDAQGREILLGDTRPRLTPKVLFVLSLINLVDCMNQVTRSSKQVQKTC